MNKNEQEELDMILEAILLFVEYFFVHDIDEENTVLKQISKYLDELYAELRTYYNPCLAYDKVLFRREFARFMSNFTFKSEILLYDYTGPERNCLLFALETINHNIVDKFTPLELKRILDIFKLK